MKKIRSLVLFLTVAAASAAMLFGCSRSSHKIVTLAGSTAFQPFAEKLAEQYMATTDGVQINVQGGGSAVGIQSALSGTADIGMADLVNLPKEAKVLSSTVVARDGIAIIVNPKNSIGSITAQQARDIFSGKIVNWKDVGGLDAEIRILSREDGSGTRTSFDTLVLKGDKIAPASLFQNSNGTIRESVASDPNAIGYLSTGLVDKRVKPLSYDGVVPTNEMVKQGKYPLFRPIYFLTKAEPSEFTKAFMTYVLSDASQKMLEAEGLLSAK